MYYGVLFYCKLDDMIVGVSECVEEVFYKCEFVDFVFWKLFIDDMLGWESLWGCGCLGWYIECFVMINKYLVKIIDIYGGG